MRVLWGWTMRNADDSLIGVDPGVLPKYPRWAVKIMYPELEYAGPTVFDVGKLERWRHPNQACGSLTGEMIYEYLQDKTMLESCLGLRDLEEIRKAQAVFFREQFGHQFVFGWKSAAMNKRDQVAVPYLCTQGNSVFLDWRPLIFLWNENDIALRHNVDV